MSTWSVRYDKPWHNVLDENGNIMAKCFTGKCAGTIALAMSNEDLADKLVRAADRIVEPQWTRERPTQDGWYWFHGIERHVNLKCQCVLVEDDYIFARGPIEYFTGLWCRAEPPALPKCKVCGQPTTGNPYCKECMDQEHTGTLPKAAQPPELPSSCATEHSEVSGSSEAGRSQPRSQCCDAPVGDCSGYGSKPVYCTKCGEACDLK